MNPDILLLNPALVVRNRWRGSIFRPRRAAVLAAFALASAVPGAFAGEALPPPATFSVRNAADVPVEWGGELFVAVRGELGGDGTDAAQWQVRLNGVPLKVASVFTQTGAALPAPDTGATLYSFVLTRPDFVATPARPDAGDVTAATIRELAPDRWSTNLVTTNLTFAGRALVAAIDPAHPKDLRNLVGFRVATPVRIGCCVGVVALLALALVYAWARTGAFRDDDPALPYHQRLFSLGRVQLAFWTVLVVSGYLFLYLMTGRFDGLLNSTASILLGISAATTVLSSVAAAPPPAAPAPAPAPVLPPPPAPVAAPRQVHVNWLVDILSDPQGMNLHRLQMAVWTVVFGMMFVSRLLNQFQFPTFDNTAYVLMGISSSTYVWFKRGET